MFVRAIERLVRATGVRLEPRFDESIAYRDGRPTDGLAVGVRNVLVIPKSSADNCALMPASGGSRRREPGRCFQLGK